MDDISSRPLTQTDLDRLFVEAQMTETAPTTYAKRMYERNVMGATRSIINLALASNNEAIRFKAATYVCDRALGRMQDAKPTGDENDPWAKLAAECIGEMDYDEYVKMRATTNNSPDNEAN